MTDTKTVITALDDAIESLQKAMFKLNSLKKPGVDTDSIDAQIAQLSEEKRELETARLVAKLSDPQYAAALALLKKHTEALNAEADKITDTAGALGTAAKIVAAAAKITAVLSTAAAL